ncbi:hypothetical protein RYX36_025626 [Vicia faba]
MNFSLKCERRPPPFFPIHSSDRAPPQTTAYPPLLRRDTTSPIQLQTSFSVTVSTISPFVLRTMKNWSESELTY